MAAAIGEAAVAAMIHNSLFSLCSPRQRGRMLDGCALPGQIGFGSETVSESEKSVGSRRREGSIMRTLPAAVLGLLSFWALGCSGDKADVSGTVTLNGTPIEEGAINYIPIEGTHGAGAGATITNGKYSIPRSQGVTPGKNRVELRAFRNTGRKVKDPTAQPGATTEERVPAFPAEYNDNSTLTRDVQPGSNTFDFNINVPEPGKSAPKR
jgi:hypothetical protein